MRVTKSARAASYELEKEQLQTSKVSGSQGSSVSLWRVCCLLLLQDASPCKELSEMLDAFSKSILEELDTVKIS
jgi:hypothetical protein